MSFSVQITTLQGSSSPNLKGMNDRVPYYTRFPYWLLTLAMGSSCMRLMTVIATGISGTTLSIRILRYYDRFTGSRSIAFICSFTSFIILFCAYIYLIFFNYSKLHTTIITTESANQPSNTQNDQLRDSDRHKKYQYIPSINQYA